MCPFLFNLFLEIILIFSPKVNSSFFSSSFFSEMLFLDMAETGDHINKK